MSAFDTKKNIEKVLLVGGTHGNELTGIHLVHQWKNNQQEKEYPLVDLDYLIANPEAVKANKRYIEHDLNRCFKKSDLENESLNSLEQSRAKEINRSLGGKGNSKIDFIIDLHTSTANMQTNIVLTRLDIFHLSLASYLIKTLPEIVITSEANLMADHHFLETVAEKGILVEVGPIPQGCLDYDCFSKTRNAVNACLEFVEKYNNGDHLDLNDNVEIMSYTSKIYFPTDQHGNISACVHPDLIGIAYPKIVKGDPLFISFSGKVIHYEGEETFLAFINEAAYYDQKIAMCCCQTISYPLNL